jgi:hypothetical protein
MVATEQGPRLLLDWVAERLAARLNDNTAALPHPYTLNDVVCWFVAARGRREEASVRLRIIDGLKPSIRALRDVQMWRGFIEHEQHT